MVTKMIVDYRRRRRRRRRESLLFLSTTLCLWLVAAAEEDTDDSGSVVIHDFCHHNYIQVDSLKILCDTPGAYYYGSSAYRNSQVCMSGDKANLDISFRIPHGMTVDSVFLKVELGLYNQFQVVGTTNLCQMPIQQSSVYTDSDDDFWGDSTECPHPGAYSLQTYYGVPSIPDYGMHYTPDVRLTFLNEDSKPLGCATSGPLAIHKEHLNKNVRGMVALSLSLLLFVGIFGGLLYLSYQKKKRLELLRESRGGPSQRYHPYMRTLNDGQVLPLPYQPRLPRTSEDEEEDESEGDVTPDTATGQRPVL